jgi:hypothetical protein
MDTDRVFFGTDWPFDLALDWPVSWILSLKSLTQEEAEMILWKNLTCAPKVELSVRRAPRLYETLDVLRGSADPLE